MYICIYIYHHYIIYIYLLKFVPFQGYKQTVCWLHQIYQQFNPPMGMAGQYHLPGPKPFPPARNIAWGNLDEAYCWRKQGTFKGSMGRPLREDFRGFLGHHRTTPLRISILCSSRIFLKQHFNSTSVFSFWKTNEQWKRTWLFKGTYGILLPSYIYIYRDYDRPLSGFLFTKHDFTKNKAVLFRGSFLTGKFHPKKGQQMMENTPIPEDVFVGKHLFKVILTHHKKCQ